MPIYTHRNATVVHFGQGDIGVATADGQEGESPPGLVLGQVEPGLIGRGVGEQVTMSDLQRPVLLLFESVRSVEVVIWKLRELKRMMGLRNGARQATGERAERHDTQR